MAIDWKKILEKISKVRDLREAIHCVKKATSEPSLEKVAELPQASETKEETPEDKDLKLLGRNKTKSGSIIFRIGIPGSDKHYEVESDLSHKRQNIPHTTVTHKSADGSILDKCPNIHNDFKSAIESVLAHHKKKRWEND